MEKELITNNWIIGLITIIAILVNLIISILYEPRLIITGLSSISILLTYVTTLLYLKQFDFPLFFVRDELNYWGGLFGGLFGGLSYIIMYKIMFSYDIKIVEIIPLTILAFCIIFLLTLSLTATLIQDIKNTDYVTLE